MCQTCGVPQGPISGPVLFSLNLLSLQPVLEVSKTPKVITTEILMSDRMTEVHKLLVYSPS